MKTVRKIIEIDECLIAVKEINNLDIFNKRWEDSDNIKVSCSSENDITISHLGKKISGS